MSIINHLGINNIIIRMRILKVFIIKNHLKIYLMKLTKISTNLQHQRVLQKKFYTQSIL